MAESATAFRLLARLLAAHDAFLDEQSRLNADAMKDAADDARAYVQSHPLASRISHRTDAGSQPLRRVGSDGMSGEETMLAEMIARHMHGDQLDKSGKLYIFHPSRVAGRVSDEAKAAAWLHDVVEDTPLGIGAIVQMFERETANAVRLLTRDPRETYFNYLGKIVGATTEGAEIAREVKIADLHDNLSEERRYPGDESIRRRYVKSLEMLAATQDNPNPEAVGS